ncbi:MAG: class I SAM-dependent methyltransferase [Anaerolineales bacterium]|nr:class I SAM-dependent methyltransferase [Anaerolineales bacterium]
MFSKSAQYYDDIYGSAGKNYVIEVNKLNKIIQKHKRSQGNTLLDLACGTGVHAGLLNKYYKVEGLDLDAQMLKVAKKKHPKIRFHQGNMIDFKLDRQYDIITCLFSSIGYVKNKSNLDKAIKNMTNHLLPGGVLLVEPWFTPEQWNPGNIFTLQVEKPDLKIVRMSLSRQKGKISFVDLHYMIGTSKGVNHLTEVHTLGLFTHAEYMDAFNKAGLRVTHNKKEPGNRGLFIGKKAVK